MKIQTRIALSILSAASMLGSTYVMAACSNCGTVTSVKTIKVKGEASGVGAVAGGVLGGVIGHQVGGGRGKDLATVAGAVGGGYAGHQTEKNIKAKMQYRVAVQLESGATRSFQYNSPTSYKAGDKIKVQDGKLMRQ